jgi:hypothetical protein
MVLSAVLHRLGYSRSKAGMRACSPAGNVGMFIVASCGIGSYDAARIEAADLRSKERKAIV